MLLRLQEVQMRKVSKSRLLTGFSRNAALTLTILAALITAPHFAVAQEVTAAITGRVTDPSGAAVAGAKVTAIDTQRGTTLPTTTNSDGAYSLPRVPVGTYNVKVENQGFQTS
jgi:hypothetical protein